MDPVKELKARGVIDPGFNNTLLQSMKWCHVKYLTLKEKPCTQVTNEITEYDKMIYNSLDYDGISSDYYPPINEIEERNKIKFDIYKYNNRSKLLISPIKDYIESKYQIISVIEYDLRYMLIKDMNSFMCAGHSSKYFCKACLKSFATRQILTEHTSYCQSSNKFGGYFPFVSFVSLISFAEGNSGICLSKVSNDSSMTKMPINSQTKNMVYGYACVTITKNNQTNKVYKAETHGQEGKLVTELLNSYYQMCNTCVRSCPEYTKCKTCNSRPGTNKLVYYDNDYYHLECFRKVFPLVVVINNTNKLLEKPVEGLRFVKYRDLINFSHETRTRQCQNYVKSILSQVKSDTINTIIELIHMNCYPYSKNGITFSNTDFPNESLFDIDSDTYNKALYLYQDNFSNFGEFVGVYKLIESCLFAFVCMKLRDQVYADSRIDILQYLRKETLSWDLFLLKTQRPRSLRCTSDVFNCAHSVPSSVIKRYSKANNKYVPGYDNTKPDTYIVHFSVSNILYDYAIRSDYSSNDLLIKDMTNLNRGIRTKKGQMNIVTYINTKAREKRLLVLVINLEYPTALHQSHSDFPLALDIRSYSSRESLTKRKNILVGGDMLEYYISKGLIVTKIHKILESLVDNKISFSTPIYPLEPSNNLEYASPEVKFCVFEAYLQVLYDFHYELIVPIIGDKARLLYRDTSSLIYEIEDFDIWPIMFSINEIGIFKDTNDGKLITEYVGLTEDSYSYSVTKTRPWETNEIIGIDSINKTRNIDQAVLDKITTDDYKSVLFNKSRVLLTNEKEDTKKVLTSVYTGRYILGDSINTLPHGHCKIRDKRRHKLINRLMGIIKN